MTKTVNKCSNHSTRLTTFAATNAETLESLVSRIIAHFGHAPLNSRYIVAVSGAGCLGKSTLAELLTYMLRQQGSFDCDWVDLDGYLIEKTLRESGLPMISGYNPKGYELHKAQHDLEVWLKDGLPFKVKIYDKLTSKRTASRDIKARDLLIIEGACALYEDLRHLTNLKLFLCATKEVQYTNRWCREKIDLRRSDIEIEQKFQHLYPDYEKFILPMMETADLILAVDECYKLSILRESNQRSEASNTLTLI